MILVGVRRSMAREWEHVRLRARITYSCQLRWLATRSNSPTSFHFRKAKIRIDVDCDIERFFETKSDSRTATYLAAPSCSNFFPFSKK